MFAAVDVATNFFGITFGVGHTKANGQDWRAFVDQFGETIQVCHLHDNDGTDDNHASLTDDDTHLRAIPATYFVFEIKSLEDIAVCVGATDIAVPETDPTTSAIDLD